MLINQDVNSVGASARKLFSGTEAQTEALQKKAEGFIERKVDSKISTVQETPLSSSSSLLLAATTKNSTSISKPLIGRCTSSFLSSKNSLQSRGKASSFEQDDGGFSTEASTSGGHKRSVVLTASMKKMVSDKIEVWWKSTQNSMVNVIKEICTQEISNAEQQDMLLKQHILWHSGKLFDLKVKNSEGTDFKNKRLKKEVLLKLENWFGFNIKFGDGGSIWRMNVLGKLNKLELITNAKKISGLTGVFLAEFTEILMQKATSLCDNILTHSMDDFITQFKIMAIDGELCLEDNIKLKLTQTIGTALESIEQHSLFKVLYETHF